MKFTLGIVVYVKDVSDETLEWLKENIGENNFFIAPHMYRFKYAGPEVPLEECQYQDGYEIWFEREEDKTLFQLAWC